MGHTSFMLSQSEISMIKRLNIKNPNLTKCSLFEPLTVHSFIWFFAGYTNSLKLFIFCNPDYPDGLRMRGTLDWPASPWEKPCK